jgi:hypothetical protein
VQAAGAAAAATRNLRLQHRGRQVALLQLLDADYGEW